MQQFKHNKKIRLSSILALGAILMLFQSFSVSAIAQQDIEDDDITRAVESEFIIDTVIDLNTLDIITTDGVVTLDGSTRDIFTKERAVDIAASTKGVRSVVNRLKVKPFKNRSDNEIQNEVRRALFEDPATDLYEVEPSVTDGIVTLSGKVQSWAEKQLCADVAKSIAGVTDIINNINIEYKEERSDFEIKEDIEGRLKNDILVDDALIKVSVTNGEAKLSGTVGTLREKTRATNDSWVVGVKAVSAKDLYVEWWARDSMRRNNFLANLSDEDIKEAVKDALLYDPRVYSFNPKVNVSLGSVTLTGVVDNLKAKNAAEQDAENTVGVWRVKNHLKVRPDVIPTNEELEEKVSNAFLIDPYVERFKVNVDAVYGIVYLTGTVNTTFEKNRAETIAEGVKGVTDVVSNINSEYVWLWKPDWEIRNDVKDQLTWDPFVNESEIVVTVDDGIVTLEGQVNNWSQVNAAKRNAFEGGAKDVVNNLVVSYQQYGPHYPDYLGLSF